MTSKRLKQIGDLVNDGAVVYDVGADHGELERYISPRVKKVIAIENKVGPYNILLNATKEYENVYPFLADGLAKLTSEVDTLIIAGMGGLLINSILEKNVDGLTSVNNIIVDAHKDIEEVRRYVSSFGYKIDKEILLKEKSHYYIVIKFIKGVSDYNELEYEFGRLLKDDLYKEYLADELDRLNDIYSKSNDEKIRSKIERMKSL